MKKPITLILPPEALERIPVIRACEFLGGYGLTLDSEIKNGQIIMTARPIPTEETMRGVRANMEHFTFGFNPPEGAA